MIRNSIRSTTALPIVLTLALCACTGGKPAKPKFAVNDCVMPPDGRAETVLKIAAVLDTTYQVRTYSVAAGKVTINGEEQGRTHAELDQGMYSAVNCPKGE